MTADKLPCQACEDAAMRHYEAAKQHRDAGNYGMEAYEKSWAGTFRSSCRHPRQAWVSVEERLPTEHDEVIAYASKEDATVFTASFFSKEWHRSSSNRYAPIDDFYGDGKIKVSHWMPLPPAPGEQEGR